MLTAMFVHDMFFLSGRRARCEGKEMIAVCDSSTRLAPREPLHVSSFHATKKGARFGAQASEIARSRTNVRIDEPVASARVANPPFPRRGIGRMERPKQHVWRLVAPEPS